MLIGVGVWFLCFSSMIDSSRLIAFNGIFFSVNSTGSGASTTTKYDPDLLKSDVQHARARVLRLQRELANIDTEMAYKQKGVDTLAQ